MTGACEALIASPFGVLTCGRPATVTAEGGCMTGHAAELFLCVPHADALAEALRKTVQGPCVVCGAPVRLLAVTS